MPPKCTKINFSRSPPPTPLGERTAFGQPRDGIGPCLKEPPLLMRTPIRCASAVDDKERTSLTRAASNYRVSQKSEPLNILQQQPQICSDLNKILRTQERHLLQTLLHSFI